MVSTIKEFLSPIDTTYSVRELPTFLRLPLKVSGVLMLNLWTNTAVKLQLNDQCHNNTKIGLEDAILCMFTYKIY